MLPLVSIAFATLAAQAPTAPSDEFDIRIVHVDRVVAGQLFEAGLAPLPGATLALTDRQAFDAVFRASTAFGTATFPALRYRSSTGSDAALDAQIHDSYVSDFEVEVGQDSCSVTPIRWSKRVIDVRLVVGFEPTIAGTIFELALDLESAKRTPKEVSTAGLEPPEYSHVRSIDRLLIPASGTVVWAATHPSASDPSSSPAPVFLVFISRGDPDTAPTAMAMFEIRLAEVSRPLAEDIAGRELVESSDGVRPLAESQVRDAERRIARVGARLSENVWRARFGPGRHTGALFRLERTGTPGGHDSFAVTLEDPGGEPNRIRVSISNDTFAESTPAIVSRSAVIDRPARTTIVWPVRRDATGPVLLLFVTPVAN